MSPARFRIGWLVGLLAAGAARAEVVTIQVPLEDGRIPVRRVFEQMLRQAGVEPGDRLRDLDWTIDAGSFAGRLQMAVFDQLAPGSVKTEVRPDAVIVTFDREAMKQHADRVVGDVDRWLSGSAVTAAGAQFGLTVVTLDNPRAPLESLPAGTRRAVVLVHGLDDPGWTWRDLAPWLIEAGYAVLRFEYPNDQPIADSADLLAASLQDLRARGVEQLDIVAHSMGGLVARDVLTRSAWYAGDGSGRGRFPAVGHLIMLGTPNHGSQMARVRGLGEAGEQISRWFSGGRPQRGVALRDGEGEAGRDLLPESDYLRRLNERPHPASTRYTIVAGRMSPVTPAQIQSLASRLDQVADGAARREADAVARWLQSVVSGVGDGLVSIESAGLDGASDMVVVEGNHMSMIVNLLPSDAVPPAIPIVLERLAQDR